MSKSQLRQQLQEEVDQLAESVDSLTRTLDETPLVGAVKVVGLDADFRSTLGALVRATSALVQTVGELHP